MLFLKQAGELLFLECCILCPTQITLCTTDAESLRKKLEEQMGMCVETP